LAHDEPTSVHEKDRRVAFSKFLVFTHPKYTGYCYLNRLDDIVFPYQ